MAWLFSCVVILECMPGKPIHKVVADWDFAYNRILLPLVLRCVNLAKCDVRRIYLDRELFAFWWDYSSLMISMGRLNVDLGVSVTMNGERLYKRWPILCMPCHGAAVVAGESCDSTQ